MKKVLLVEPDFPIPQKSKNHKNFLPIGLLKIATYLKEKGYFIKLYRGIPNKIEEFTVIKKFNPQEVWITSLFTYWAKYVKDTVQYYKSASPKSKVIVGGIFASLFTIDEVKKYTGCNEVFQGVIPEAEKCSPAYNLIENSNPNPIDYQIIHASRGCDRRCSFCGTWKIEPKFLPEKSIINKIRYKKIVFYDNNFFMNPYIKNILEELIELKKEKKLIWCESQSGFDGRILLKKPYLAKMIKKAGFRYPRIAWDWNYEEHPEIQKQIDILVDAGYNSKEIYVFILYNWEIIFEEIEKKRIKCWYWNVQISDCRYRPLNQLYDNYDSRKINQTSKDYYIHKNWTDSLIKKFRKYVRMQNICVRHGFPFYSKSFENKKFGNEIMRKVKEAKSMSCKITILKDIGADYWIPDNTKDTL